MKKTILALFVFAACIHVNPATHGHLFKKLTPIPETRPAEGRPDFFTPKPAPVTPPKTAPASLKQDPRERAMIQSLIITLERFICLDKDFSIAHEDKAAAIEAALYFCEKSISLSLALLNLFNHQLSLRLFEFPKKLPNPAEIKLLLAIKEKLNHLAKNSSFIDAVTARAECSRAQIESNFRLSAQTLHTFAEQQQKPKAKI